jgi:hypothetical protein
MAPTIRNASVVSGPNEHRVGAGMAAGNSGPGMGAQEAQKEARSGQDGAQRALLLEQAKKAAARLAELVGELAETGASMPPEEAGLEERLKAAAAALQMTGPECQATDISERGERSLVVGVLRADVAMAVQGADLRRGLPSISRMPTVPSYDTGRKNGLGGHSQPLSGMPHPRAWCRSSNLPLPRGIERAVRQAQVQTVPSSAIAHGRETGAPLVPPLRAERQ